MASVIDICNMALDLAEGETINALPPIEDTPNSRLCNRHYTQCRDELQREYRWNFNKTSVSLALLTTLPTGNWTYAYQLPTNFMKFYQFVGDDNLEIEYDIYEGKQLLCNESTAKIIYGRKVTEPVAFDSVFIKSLTYRLASRIAPKLTNSRTKTADLFQQAEAFAASAAGVDSQDTPEEKAEQSTWLNARN